MRSALGAILVFCAPVVAPIVVSVAQADNRTPSARKTPSSSASPAAVEGDDDDDPSTGVPPQGPAIANEGRRAGDSTGADELPSEGLPVPPRQLSYHGVAPGNEGLPPRAPHLPARGPARMTWPGFQVQNGVATVFLQLTAEPEWAASEQPTRIVYTLRRTTVPLANNRRALEVSEFGTVVKSVSARRKGHDVEVTIELKQKATHRERTGEAAGGFRFLVIELLPS